MSLVDVEENIFSYNTYNDHYVNEDEYSSDTSTTTTTTNSDDLSSSPFKYDKVVGINIPHRNHGHVHAFNTIASPQPESKFNIGSTIESFNEIADFIYENGKKKDIDDQEFIPLSESTNSIKKNDTFIKNYLDHTRYGQGKKEERRSKEVKPNYITFKSLSNRKVNSNDIIDRGCLSTKPIIDLDDFLAPSDPNRLQEEEEEEEENLPETERSYYDEDGNVFDFEHDSLHEPQPLHESTRHPAHDFHSKAPLENYPYRNYILTEPYHYTADIELQEQPKPLTHPNYNPTNNLSMYTLNTQNIYDDLLFNLS